jgi:hypothetical protein
MATAPSQPKPPTAKPKPAPLAPKDITATGIIKAFLHELGLDGLADWMWKRYKAVGSLELVKLEMENRHEYKQRFAGRLKLREQGIQMSEAEQIAWEKSAGQLMHQAGMPKGFYDNWSDFQGMIGNGVSPAELSDRINNGFAKVAQAPPEIRRAMGEYYGASADSALAALVLDKNKATPAIMREVAAAEAGGYLTRHGIDIERNLAERIAGMAGYQSELIKQGADAYGKLNEAGIFDAQFGEQAPTKETAVNAFFAGDARATQDVEYAIETRKAQTSGEEAFQSTNRGVVGLGSVEE